MTALLSLLAAAAMTGGAFGFVSAVALRRRRRRTRTVFALGFLCGAAASVIYDVRRRGVPLRSLRKLSLAALMSAAGK